MRNMVLRSPTQSVAAPVEMLRFVVNSPMPSTRVARLVRWARRACSVVVPVKLWALCVLCLRASRTRLANYSSWVVRAGRVRVRGHFLAAMWVMQLVCSAGEGRAWRRTLFVNVSLRRWPLA